MRIAICDDDEIQRLRCRRQIERLAEVHNIEVEIALYGKGEELLFHLEDVKKYADIIYLDMSMKGMEGVSVAHRLRERGCTSELIFFTISKEYYSSAFDVGALHYIVKGVTPDFKFEEIFLRAVRAAEEKKREYIMCSGAGEYRNIDIRSIRYFQVVRRIVTVYYGKKDEFSFYSTFGKIVNRLDDYGFIRIHRSYLVSTEWVRTISYKEVVLHTGETLPVGRSYYTDLKAAMENAAMGHKSSAV